MKKRYQVAGRLLLAVFISSTSAYLGIAMENTIVKVLSVACQLIVLYMSIDVLKRYQHFVRWNAAMLLLGILSGYPLLRSVIELSHNMSFKNFTDAMFVQGGYYQLGIAGLAMAVLTRDGCGYPLLYRYAFYAVPIGILLMTLGIRADAETNIGMGQMAINNCFIPVALLALNPTKRKTVILGWVCIFLVALLASRIWSRSYTLVGAYLGALAIFALFSRGRKAMGYLLLSVLVVAYFSGAFSFLTHKSVVQDASVVDKYNFSSLKTSLEQFARDGDVVKLFFWEGNSRAGIIMDAFGNFSQSAWITGKGIFGTYTSFTRRSTIEIGWAQELFRWGILYVVLTLFILLYARRRLRKGTARFEDMLVMPLAGLLLVKFLDGFVYGMPYYTVYNALVFWGVMRTTVINTPILPAHVAKRPDPALARAHA